MNKREQQRQMRREQILACCLDRIISYGYAGMKLRDIASELHISPGLIFNYFESKEQIYEELVKLGVGAPMDVLGKSVSRVQEPLKVFESMTEFIFHAITVSSFTAKMFLLMTMTQKSEDVPPSVKKLLQGFDMFTPLVAVIRVGQKKGEIKAGDPVALLVAYWGAVQGVATYRALEPALPMPESGWIMDMLRA